MTWEQAWTYVDRADHLVTLSAAGLAIVTFVRWHLLVQSPIRLWHIEFWPASVTKTHPGITIHVLFLNPGLFNRIFTDVRLELVRTDVPGEPLHLFPYAYVQPIAFDQPDGEWKMQIVDLFSQLRRAFAIQRSA